MIKKYIFRAVSTLLGLSGIVLLSGVLVPIISYEVKARQEYPDLVSPVAQGFTKEPKGASAPQGGPVVLGEKSPASDEVDYTKAVNWFPGANNGRQFASPENILFYTLSVPKLNIKNATVAVGGEDLTENLIQYPGTALPGKTGNAMVFGHSILPIFYDPTNYLAIFSTIDKLGKGDEIFVDYDGITYKYRVLEKFEVRPTDVYILDQNTSGKKYLSLVTCSPPGDPRKPKRLVVRAELVAV